MIFLHIGLNKTGSSSIQAFCDQHRAVLRELGLDYPTAGGSPSLRLAGSRRRTQARA